MEDYMKFPISPRVPLYLLIMIEDTFDIYVKMRKNLCEMSDRCRRKCQIADGAIAFPVLHTNKLNHRQYETSDRCYTKFANKRRSHRIIVQSYLSIETSNRRDNKFGNRP